MISSNESNKIDISVNINNESSGIDIEEIFINEIDNSDCKSSSDDEMSDQNKRISKTINKGRSFHQDNFVFDFREHKFAKAETIKNSLKENYKINIDEQKNQSFNICEYITSFLCLSSEKNQ